MYIPVSIESMIRCVNLDWLEVFAFETGEPHDENYFRRAGFLVESRDYGTRIYHEMFTIFDTDGHPFIEVRRKPKSELLPYNATHIRFVNRSCYLDHAARLMQQFLDRYAYIFQRISRVDICLDFVRFDDNTIPRVFMGRYMRGKFSKINQSNIHSHGSDRWTGRVWNSVSWGSPSSMISTKFYNKTLELYDPKTDSFAKPHIRYAWLNSGLIDNMDRCTLRGESQEIWRVEFSIKSSVKRWCVIELNGKNKAYQSLHNTLDVYDSKDKLLTMFAALQFHYFHFKRYIIDKRKDLCPDRRLFNFSQVQQCVKPEHPDAIAANKPDGRLLILIKTLRDYILTSDSMEARHLAERLLKTLEAVQLRQEMSRPYSREERTALQLLIQRRRNGELSATFDAILTEVKEVLSLNEKTMPFLEKTPRKKAVQ